jgi:hypothetical protein
VSDDTALPALLVHRYRRDLPDAGPDLAPLHRLRSALERGRAGRRSRDRAASARDARTAPASGARGALTLKSSRGGDLTRRSRRARRARNNRRRGGLTCPPYAEAHGGAHAESAEPAAIFSRPVARSLEPFRTEDRRPDRSPKLVAQRDSLTVTKG